MINETAFAKINLYLHVTGKRDDGYHCLDSLVIFSAQMADEISVSASEKFSVSVDGDFANVVGADNLVVRAAHAAAKAAGRAMDFCIHLRKNIPAGAGLGGGSADAAATVRALEKFWSISIPQRDGMLLSLGADVPACYSQNTLRFQGVGEIITARLRLPSFHLLLVWPDVHSATKDVFRHRTGDFSASASLPDSFADLERFVQFLRATRNDLAAAAESLNPAIAMARNYLDRRPDCLLARMSGSGSAVFGIFGDAQACAAARSEITAQHPGWWVRSIFHADV